MLLTIDIGNSNIIFGIYKGEELIFVARIATDLRKTGDQYAIDIKDILALYGVDPAPIDSVIISSVVPSLELAFKRTSNALFGVTPLIVGPGVKSGLDIKIDNPAQLGADLVATAVAAIKKHPLPAVIFDFGTATKAGVIDKNGVFIGAVISAGMEISLDALAKNTSLLPQISIEAPKSVIGKNSVDSMKSGLVLGTAAMIDGIYERICEEIGEKATLIATGGLANEVVKHCKHKIIYNEFLLLDGLKAIFDKNR